MIKQTKLAKAPYFNEQATSDKVNDFTDWIIFAGDKAFSAYDKGKGTEWLLLCENVWREKVDERIAPVVLDKAQLENIQALRIAPATQRYIKIYQFGSLTQAQLTAICVNLAHNNAIEGLKAEIYTNLGELQENGDLSPYIAKIRKGDSVAEMVAEAVGSSTNGECTNRNAPYIENRTSNGVKGLYRVIPKYDNSTGGIIKRG